MAHIETWYRCPCGATYDSQGEANRCAIRHVRQERWAVGKGGKAVRIWNNTAPGSMYSAEWALQEADLSDNIEKRKRQLEAREIAQRKESQR